MLKSKQRLVTTIDKEDCWIVMCDIYSLDRIEILQLVGNTVRRKINYFSFSPFPSPDFTRPITSVEIEERSSWMRTNYSRQNVWWIPLVSWLLSFIFISTILKNSPSRSCHTVTLFYVRYNYTLSNENSLSFLLGCCWCCSALRPRYKRLVDNIFPVNPQVLHLL